MSLEVRQGDIWIDEHDASEVIIVTSGARYVEFMRARDRVEIYYLRHFVDRFRPHYDRPGIRRQFVFSLANLHHLHAFWCPISKRFFSRTGARSPADAYMPRRGRGGALPATALYIGTYGHPFEGDEFLDDLDALITKQLHALRTQPRDATDPRAAAAALPAGRRGDHAIESDRAGHPRLS
jgi:hypothetical protein